MDEISFLPLLFLEGCFKKKFIFFLIFCLCDLELDSSPFQEISLLKFRKIEQRISTHSRWVSWNFVQIERQRQSFHSQRDSKSFEIQKFRTRGTEVSRRNTAIGGTAKGSENKQRENLHLSLSAHREILYPVLAPLAKQLFVFACNYYEARRKRDVC